MKRICFLLAAVALTGCDTIYQRVSTQRTLADGTVEIQTSESRVSAKLDAKGTIEKLRVSNGKTQSIGIAGLEQEATSTNLTRAAVDLMRASADLLSTYGK